MGRRLGARPVARGLRGQPLPAQARRRAGKPGCSRACSGLTSIGRSRRATSRFSWCCRGCGYGDAAGS